MIQRVPDHGPTAGIGLPQRIIIADDSRAIRSLLSRYLQSWGVSSIREAPDGAAAWALAHKYSADVIITDLEMPIVSGIELLTAIRASLNPALRSVPVLVISSVMNRETIHRILITEQAYYMPKPVDPRELQIMLRLIATMASPRMTDSILRKDSAGV